MQRQIVYALGFFDGLHLGHRAIIKASQDLAREMGAENGVFTYENHPQTVVGGGPPPLLTTPVERHSLFQACGVQNLSMIPFDPRFASQTPEEFLDMLVGQYHCAGLCCGNNFHFGAKARGDSALLIQLCAQRGLGIRVVPPVTLDGALISSTLVRTLLREGRTQEATRCLGRPFSLAGEIVHGDGRGHKMGIPTINLAPDAQLLLPAAGVYATMTQVEGGPPMASLTNVGQRPTFRTGGGTTIETHITSFRGDIYGQGARIWFCHFLRGERRFESAAQLVEQIAADTKRATALLASEGTGEFYELF